MSEAERQAETQTLKLAASEGALSAMEREGVIASRILQVLHPIR